MKNRLENFKKNLMEGAGGGHPIHPHLESPKVDLGRPSPTKEATAYQS